MKKETGDRPNIFLFLRITSLIIPCITLPSCTFNDMGFLKNIKPTVLITVIVTVK